MPGLSERLAKLLDGPAAVADRLGAGCPAVRLPHVLSLVRAPVRVEHGVELRHGPVLRDAFGQNGRQLRSHANLLAE